MHSRDRRIIETLFNGRGRMRLHQVLGILIVIMMIGISSAQALGETVDRVNSWPTVEPANDYTILSLFALMRADVDFRIFCENSVLEHKHLPNVRGASVTLKSTFNIEAS